VLEGVFEVKKPVSREVRLMAGQQALETSRSGIDSLGNGTQAGRIVLLLRYDVIPTRRMRYHKKKVGHSEDRGRLST